MSEKEGAKPVPLPKKMCGVHVMAWVMGRGCALNGKGWRCPFEVTRRVRRAFRLGWLSQKLGQSLYHYGLRKRWAERSGEKWNRNTATRERGVQFRCELVTLLGSAKEPMRLTDLAPLLGAAPSAVHRQLDHLKAQGKVRQAGKRYTLVKEVAA